jgi:NAD+--dinitrogen-reductase ADP-D-ribosyltransferase
MSGTQSGLAYNKAPDTCRDSDNPVLPADARLPINRCNLPALILGGLTYQQYPVPLVIDGVAELHREFLAKLDAIEDLSVREQRFHAYMKQCFCLDDLQQAGLSESAQKRRLDYLRLLRGWHFNSDSIEGAVLKSWVESRFGLLPRYHMAPIRDHGETAYRQYLEHRATGLYNSNALEAQLDLVYTFTQTELARRQPGRTHLKLYRGVNQWREHEQLGQHGGQTLILLNNVNSFSSSFERAGEFGDTLFETDVPLAKIICCADVFPGKLQGEGEYLVIGGIYGVKKG